jgi:predicted nucleic acid-binding protein
MKLLFVDTAGWLMMADESDPLNRKSIAERNVWLEGGGLLVSTDYVLDETLTIIRLRLGLKAAEKWWRHFEGSTRVRWEWVGAERAEKARAMFFRWADKSFSLTDCTSFVVMRELNIKLALTSDRHFAMAGFKILPERNPQLHRSFIQENYGINADPRD